MMMFIGLAIIAFSVFLVAGGLRMIAQDTVQTLASATNKARSAGTLIPKMAFVSLWLMIFALSYL
jgi:hypothetical protein